MHVKQSIELAQCAILLGINYKTAWAIVNLYKTSFKITKNAKSGSGVKIFTPEILRQVEDLISLESEYILRDLKEKLEFANIGFSISLPTANKALQNWL